MRTSTRTLAFPAVRHIGPLAQDFAGAFGVGEDGRHITAIDTEGVALAAIQGLNQKLEERSAALQAHFSAREAELQALKQSVLEPRQALARMSQPPQVGGRHLGFDARPQGRIIAVMMVRACPKGQRCYILLALVAVLGIDFPPVFWMAMTGTALRRMGAAGCGGALREAAPAGRQRFLGRAA